MGRYIVKRILLAILTVFIICAITFFVMNAIPGGPFNREKALSAATIEALNRRYNLDKPVPEQFLLYMKNLLHGDFGVSLKNGLGANDEIHGCTVAPCRSADGSVGERQQADVAASHADAAGRSAESGAASGADDRTGWEAEREFFFSAQNQTSQTASATCQYSGIDFSADGGGSTASALVGLGHRLEQLQSAAPVMPVQHHTDRKVLQKEREKKIALGHKADDHEDEVSYDWQQTM